MTTSGKTFKSFEAGLKLNNSLVSGSFVKYYYRVRNKEKENEPFISNVHCAQRT